MEAQKQSVDAVDVSFSQVVSCFCLCFLILLQNIYMISDLELDALNAMV